MDPVRFSDLRLMALSPAHYKAGHGDKTHCMELGSATDALILGTQEVVAYPGPVRRGLAWIQFKAENADKLIVTRSELATAGDMRGAVLAHPHAPRLLTGFRQKEIFWKYCGRDCVSHLDVLGDGFVTELKTSKTSCPGRYRWHASKMGYLAQMAFYMDAAEAFTGQRPKHAYQVVVESKPPYVVTTFRLTERALEVGARTIRSWFERLLACEAADEWPGYAQGIEELDVPEDMDLDWGDFDQEIEKAGEPAF